MFTLYITQNKTLLFATIEEAERFADIIEKKTGHRPNITTARNFNSQQDVSFGMIKPNYGGK